MTGERGDARKRNLTVVPCCDAAAAVARVRELADEWAAEAPTAYSPQAHAVLDCERDLRAALDGPGDGAA